MCDEELLCVEALTLTWELVQGLSTNAHDFWPALKGFVSMAFQRQLLSVTSEQAPPLSAAVKQVSRRITPGCSLRFHFHEAVL